MDSIIISSYNYKINSNSIVATTTKEFRDTRFEKIRTRSLLNLENNKTRGILSNSAKNKLKHSINWLLVSSQKKIGYSFKNNSKYIFAINFITLTIPPQEEGLVSNLKFKSILNAWLTYARLYCDLNNYVWKIEKHKDNRLHIHILSDTFIHHKKIKDSWNTLLQKNGLLEFHFKKFSNYSPNSTDVHSIKKIKNIAGYVIKYMAKDGLEDNLFRGRIWGCSSKISKIRNTTIKLTPQEDLEKSNILAQKKIDWKPITTEKDSFGNSYTIGEIYFLNVKDWIKLQGSIFYEKFKEIVLFLRPEQKLKLNF